MAYGLGGLGTYALKRLIGNAIGTATRAAGGAYARSFSKVRTGGVRSTRRIQKRSQRVYTGRKVFMYGPRNRPMPTAQVMRFDVENIGYWAAAAGQTNTMTVAANYVFHPFNTGTSTIPNPLVAIATLDPNGLTALLTQALYQRFLVRSSSITVQMAASSIDDTLCFAVVPVVIASADPSKALWANYSLAAAAPCSKELMVQPDYFNKISNYCKISTIFNVDDQMYKSDPNNIGTAAAAPGNQVLWQIIYQTADQATNAGKIFVRVNVSYWVELFSGASTGEQSA